MRALLAVPQWREMYFRRLRTLVNDLLATGRMEARLRRRARSRPVDGSPRLRGLALPERADATRSSRTRLFNDIQARRTVFASDARVPGNQPAAPNIVIDEIQHSPTSGDTAEFVELYNPGTPGDRPVRLDDRRRHRPRPSSPAP